ncbi:ketopantoate reductase family protein [Catenulispora rubra]|uniref:ketopantoate reductase family protein n=1 Tax=Catenulispora rubra TaxID=280293 RepID=UPI001E3A881C|nr:2-dehydropantoate 2-reductase [Catenulispora rubra]
MVGAGAVGGFVGGRLTEAGREVDFLVRSRRAAELSRDGLRIVDRDRTEVIDVRVVTAPLPQSAYDLVLVSVKGQALPAAIEDFKAAVGPDTVVLPFLNGINHSDTLTRAFGPAVVGATLTIGAQLDGDGAIRQLFPGGGIEVGELSGASTERVKAIVEALSIPGFTVTVPADITAAMWLKWVFIATIGAITSLARGTIGEAAAVADGVAFAEDVLAETSSVAHAAGFPVSEEGLAVTKAMATASGAPITSSLSRSLLAGQVTEVEAVLGDLIVRARELKVSVPRIEAAAFALRTHNARVAAA